MKKLIYALGIILFGLNSLNSAPFTRNDTKTIDVAFTYFLLRKQLKDKVATCRQSRQSVKSYKDFASSLQFPPTPSYTDLRKEFEKRNIVLMFAIQDLNKISKPPLVSVFNKATNLWHTAK